MTLEHQHVPGGLRHLLEAGTWANSKVFTTLTWKKWVVLLIGGFCNISLISVFMIVFKFEADGNLNSYKRQLSLCLDTAFHF